MKSLTTLLPTLAAALTIVSCSTAPKTPEKRSDLERQSEMALSKAEQREPQLDTLCRNSVAYAVFPTVGKGAAGVGGAYGKGVLYERGQPVGYCDMTQASVGLQLGGQTYTEIVCFENQEALQKFKADQLAMDAQASAVALEAGAGKNMGYTHGVAVVTTDESGFMAEASVGGQKFTYEPR